MYRFRKPRSRKREKLTHKLIRGTPGRGAWPRPEPKPPDSTASRFLPLSPFHSWGNWGTKKLSKWNHHSYSQIFFKHRLFFSTSDTLQCWTVWVFSELPRSFWILYVELQLKMFTFFREACKMHRFLLTHRRNEMTTSKYFNLKIDQLDQMCLLRF